VMIDKRGGRPLDVPPDLPVGVHPFAPRRITQVGFADKSALLLYTDGLVERRGPTLAEGISRLIAAVEDGTPEQICARALGSLRSREATEDVAAFAIGRWS